MKKIILILIFLNLYMFLDSETLILKGYLIDNLCRDFMIKKFGINGNIKFVKKHKKECCLLPQCINSGFSLYTQNGEMFEIAEESKDLIIEYLKIKENYTKVIIEGEIIDKKLRIIKIIKYKKGE